MEMILKRFWELNRFLFSFCILFSVYTQKQWFINQMLILDLTEILFLPVCCHDYFPAKFRRKEFPLIIWCGPISMFSIIQLIDILGWGHAVFQGFDVTSFQLRYSILWKYELLNILQSAITDTGFKRHC